MYNMPDGCYFASDLDFYEAMNPTEREDRDDYCPEEEEAL